MDKLEFVRQRLDSMRTRWAEVTFISGKSNRTLYNVVKREHVPDTETIEKLYNAIKSMKVKK